jgi:2-dehydro-3-deoxygluconokinase
MPGSTVVCLGEALALVPALPGSAAAPDEAEPDPATAQLAGAEANVAGGLAAAGVPTAWVGRLGTDRLGEFLHAQLRARGVETGGVQRDPARPTGYYAKELDPDDRERTRMRYRRAGSAASAMDPAFLDLPAVAQRLAAARWVHTSGITAALSDSCAALMRALLSPDGRHPRRGLLSFDVNWREQMWPDGDPALVVELAGLADLVLVGADEARWVFGTDEAAALRRLLPRPRLLVIKDGDRRALAVGPDGEVVAEPALRVQVVESVGAGDAFAAGLLTGLVRGEPVHRCLRRGHLSAAAVLTVHADSAAPPTGARGDALLDAPTREWATIRVGPDGFCGAVAAPGARR